MKPFPIFIRGILMGICDVIPGVSGGTIAFITGIYERLIKLVNNIIPAILLLFKGEVKKAIKSFDLFFSVPLLLGIIISIFVGSYAMTYLLDNFISVTLSFFVGLILISSLFIFKQIKTHKKTDVCFGFIGFIIGVILAVLSPTSIVPTYPLILISGFFAILAMFLPGISGSFILLLMGMYKHTLNALHNADFVYLLLFMIGAGVGAITIAKIVTYLLRKFHSKTLYALLGLVLGALFVPIKGIDFNLISILFIVMGALIAYIISKYANK